MRFPRCVCGLCFQPLCSCLFYVFRRCAEALCFTLSAALCGCVFYVLRYPPGCACAVVCITFSVERVFLCVLELLLVVYSITCGLCITYLDLVFSIVINFSVHMPGKDLEKKRKTRDSISPSPSNPVKCRKEMCMEQHRNFARNGTRFDHEKVCYSKLLIVHCMLFDSGWHWFTPRGFHFFKCACPSNVTSIQRIVNTSQVAKTFTSTSRTHLNHCCYSQNTPKTSSRLQSYLQALWRQQGRESGTSKSCTSSFP